MNIVIETVAMSNFMSFGKKPTSVLMDVQQNCLIVGDNRDIGSPGESRNGAGKCLGRDTPILMYDGTIKMVQDIKVGDVLMGPDGTKRNVLSVASGREELFRVKQNLGDDYIVNRSHILSLKVGTTRPTYGHFKGDVINIPVETYLSYPRHVQRGVCGYVADLVNLDDGHDDLFDPWLLGIWLADGTSSKSQITINNDDVEIYDEVERIVSNYGYKISLYPSGYRPGCKIVNYSGGFLTKLRELGVLNNKHIPEEYLRSSYQNRLDLLAGILDGDGYYPGDRHLFDIILKDNKLVDDLVFLARSVGLRVSVNDKFCKCQNFDGDVYKRITITGEIEKIPNRLSRKKASKKPDTAKPRNHGVTGIQLESLGEGDYYGFEIDGDRLFCLGDFTVTHNTTIQQAVMFGLYGKGIDGKIKADEFINLKNEKKLLVEVVFRANNVRYRVVRRRKPSSLSLHLLETEGEVDLTQDSMANTDKTLEEILGVSYDVFMGVFFLSPHRESFMAMSGPNQRKFIEDVLDLDTLVKRSESLKKIAKDQVKVDLKLIQKDIENAESTNTLVNSTIERLQGNASRFDRDIKKEQEECLETLDLASGLDFDEAMNRIASIPDARDIDDLNAKKDSIETRIKTIDGEVATKTKIADQLVGITRKDDGFSDSKKSRLTELEDELDRYHDCTYYKNQIARREEASAKRKQLDRVVSLIEKSDSELDRLEDSGSKLIDEIEKLEGGVCPTCGTEDHGPKLKKMIEERRTKAEEITQRIDELDSELTVLNEKRARLEDEIENLDAHIDDGDPEKELRARENLLERIDRVSGEDNPYHEQVIEMTQTYGTLESITVNIAELDTERKTLKSELESVTKAIGEFHTRRKQLVSECEDKYGTSDINVLKDFMGDVTRAKDRLDELKGKVNPWLEEIESAREGYVDVSELNSAKTDLEKRLKHIDYLVKLLNDSKSFIRRNIVDQYVPFLNKKINEYASRLGLGHVVEINSDMTVDLFYMQKAVSYHLMSQGERMRLNTATTMAFRDLMGLLGRNCNLLMVDEMFDSALDTSGCHDMIKFIGGRADNLLMISHREEFEGFMDSKMIVTKENGFSRIDIV